MKLAMVLLQKIHKVAQPSRSLKEDINDVKIEVKSDNAPVQPKPPGDIPQEQQQEGGQTPPKDDAAGTNKQAPPSTPPKQDGPPADE